MLIEFRVENHRSILNEQALSMEAVRRGGGEWDDPRLREVQGRKLLTVAVIAGANASGKSSVLSALQFMQDAVLHSFTAWRPGEGIPRSPFLLEGQRSNPSLFEVHVLLDSGEYRYGFSADDEAFHQEWLERRDPNTKRWSRLLDRRPGEIKLNRNISGETLTKTLLSVIENRPNALLFSAAAQFGLVAAMPLHAWFQASRFSNPPHLDDSFTEFRSWIRNNAEDSSNAPASHVPLRDLLMSADLGISDIVYVDNVGVLVEHPGRTERGWLHLSSESRGTQILFHLARQVLEVLASGGLWVVDELDASLHTRIVTEIVRMFNDPATNHNNAQMLATTHDHGVLDEIRRDQLWLTNKDPFGRTELMPVTDFKPRANEKLSRGYLQGRYGGVPLPSGLVYADIHED